MQDNLVTYESAREKFELLVPDELKPKYLETLYNCKDAAVGIADNCEAAFTVTQCIFKHIGRFLFP